MKMLFLDDSEERWLMFYQLVKKHEVDWAKTVQEAINFLISKEYDSIFLDHALGGNGTGYEVAKWIALNLKYKPKNIFLHTGDSSGAADMQEVLRNGGFISKFFPFFDLIEAIKENKCVPTALKT